MGLLDIFRGKPVGTPEPRKEPDKAAQAKAIYLFLKAGNVIDQRTAIERFGCYRLSARIWDIRNRDEYGHPAIVTDKRGKGGFARYRMVTEDR